MSSAIEVLPDFASPLDILDGTATAQPARMQEALSGKGANELVEAHPAQVERTSAWVERFSSGAMIFDLPADIPALWGEREEVLWAEGEGLMIAASQGVGKTTIAQQLILHMIGVRHGKFLGYDVAPRKRVLYLAMDRPRQAQRSLRRMVEPSDVDALNDRLVLWSGPPPASVVAYPTLLIEMAHHADADVIVIDSLKDLVPGLTDDTVGSAVNTALQHAIAAGVQVLVLHHTRKHGNDSSDRKVRSVDDIYGSTWLTSGLGSVLMIHGKPGDSNVKMEHLKQPAETVGPFSLNHDHANGITTRDDEKDPAKLLGEFVNGASAKEFAAPLYGDRYPARNDIERARRKLNRLVDAGLASKSGSGVGTTYRRTRPGQLMPTGGG